MKNFIYKLLIPILILISSSCALDVQQCNKGSLSFKLPENISSRSSIEIKGTSNLPSSYEVTLESKDDNKIVYNNEHKAGSSVNIPNLPFGRYEISVKGVTPSRIFSDKQFVEVRTERTTCNINLKVEELFGDIILTIKPNKDYVSYLYTLENGHNESVPHYITDSNSNGNKEVIIKDLSTVDSYTLNVYAENSSGFYLIGNSKLKDIKVKSGEVTSIYIENFDMYTGTISLSSVTEKKDLRVSIVEKDSGKLLRTVEPTTFPVVLKGIPPYITYNVIVESKTNDDISYSVNKDFILSPGEKAEGNIEDKPRSIYYVSESGNDKNLGTKAYPLNTINAALKKGAANKALTIVIQGELSDNVILDKPLSLTIKGENNSKVDVLRSERNAIKIDNDAASVTLENISVISDKDSININKGNLILLNDANILDIKLSPDTYITVGGLLGNSLINPPIINSDNFASFTSPIIKVTNDISLDKIYDKFLLSDSHYKLSSNGTVVINNEVTIPKKGTLNVTSSTVTPTNLSLSLTNGRETIEKEVVSFPFNIELDEGIWEVTVIGGDVGERISLPNGQYYKVKGDSVIEVPMVASAFNVFYVNGKTGDDSVNIGDLSSPYKTINKALSEIVKIGNERFDFTINVSDTVNEENEIFINYPINLTITGEEKATIKAVNPNGSLSDNSNHRVICLAHPNASLTLKNLTITGGYIDETAYAPVDYYGSAIRVDNGNLTMENTVVRDNGGVLHTDRGDEEVIQSIYIYDGGGLVTLKGSSIVEDGIIELRSGKTINVSGELTNINVATISIDNLGLGTTVLTGDVLANNTKFTLADKYMNYEIDSEGKTIDKVLNVNEFNKFIKTPEVSIFEKTIKVNASQEDLQTLSNTLKAVSGKNNVLDQFSKLKLDLSESTFTNLPTNVFAGVYLLDIILPPTLITMEKEAFTNSSYPDGTFIENVYFTDLSPWRTQYGTFNVTKDGGANKALINNGGGLYSEPSTRYDSASSAKSKIEKGEKTIYVSLKTEEDYKTLNQALNKQTGITVNLHSVLPYIPSGAFNASNGLDAINIPNNILMIGKDAFNGSSVKTIKMDDSNSYWAKKGDYARFKPSTYSIEPAELTRANSNDLYKMETVGNETFQNYESENVYAAVVVESVDDYKDLSYDIKNMRGNNLYLYIISTIDIPSNAFNGCNKLKSIHIGPGVTSIGENAFTNSGITSITFDNIQNWGNKQVPDVLVSQNGSENLTNFGTNKGTLTTTVSLEDFRSILSHKEVIYNSFSNSTIRIKINTPEEFTTLNEILTLLNDTRVYVGLDISSSTTITEIPDSAFKETRINNIILPSTVTRIGKDAFRDCRGFGNNMNDPFVIPKNVTEIGATAFSFDSDEYLGLCYLIFEDSTSSWNLRGSDTQTFTPSKNQENDAKALKITYKDYTWVKQN